MNTIIGGFVGLLVIVAIVIIGPTMAGSIDAARPSVGTTCSYTNTTSGVTFTGVCGATATDTAYTYNVAYSPDSQWNPSYNTAMPTGSSLWVTSVTIGGVVILVFFIALAIYYIRVIA